MKRYRGLCVVLFVLSLSFVAYAQNLVGDPGFETGGVWNTFGNCGRESWANRSGNYGVALYGWDVGAYGGIWQDVESPGPGTYTFSLYVRFESGFVTPPTTFELKLEAFAMDHGTKTETDSIADWRSIPKDGFWHHIYVTKTYTNPATAYIRPVLYAAWPGGGSGAQGVMIDDASLYVGTYTGSSVLMNGGFEEWNGTSQWRGVYWATYQEGDMGIEPWANHSGNRGVALWGWGDDSPYFTTQIGQPLTLVPTGTYTFSAWMQREADFKLSNMALKIEFYDITLTNKVQADAVTNFIVPNDSLWRNYYVVGSITNPAVYEVRPIIEGLWRHSAVGGSRALKIDDARFFPAAHDGWGVLTEWGYHGAAGANPQMEQVPGTNVGPFLQVNYNTHTNTFYILAPSPTVAKYSNLGDVGYVGVRAAYNRPEDGSWPEVYKLGNKIGQIVIPSGGFRGLPASGSVTVDLWKVQLEHPKDTNGNYYVTNAITVYYVPYFAASNAGMWTETKFLVASGGLRTNAWGQQFHNDFWGKDYTITIRPPIVNDAFTNGGFENPSPGSNSLEGTGWVGMGGANRENWAWRTGLWGAMFPSWDPGSATLYQDALTAGGSEEFSFYIRVQPGANPTSLEARIEWYDSDGALVQVNRRSLLGDIAKGAFWTKVCVLGHCNAPGLQRARYLITGSYLAGTEPYNEAIHIDDADVQEVSSTLKNPGFETGPQWFPEGWYVQPGNSEIGGQELWANRSGANGFALYAWNTNYYTGRLMQPIGVAGPSSYVFSIWIRREPNMNLSNMALRLEWFGADYPNKVQADTVKVLNVPADNQWRQYAITGTCAAASLKFVQTSIEFAFGPGTSGLDHQSLVLDDAEFYSTNVVGGETVDGIPVWWLQQYGLGLTNGVGAGDHDGDGFSNAEEYAADTNPTDNNSWFRGVYGAGVSGGFGLISTASSSTGRYYFLQYKTNLLDASPWLPYGGDVPGNIGGGPVIFTTTNDAPQRFYRLGVRP